MKLLKLFTIAFLLSALAIPNISAQNRNRNRNVARSTPQAATRSTQTPTALQNPDLVKKYQALISEQLLMSHLYYYASDALEGRETTTRGQKLAARYLAAQYQRMGLIPKGNMTGATSANDPRKFMQPVPLTEERITHVQLSASNGVDAGYHPAEGTGTLMLQMGSAGEVEGGFVFGGYGIGADSLKYSDYQALKDANIKMAGKWLMILDKEPMSADGKSKLTSNGEPSNFSKQWWTKLQAAFATGDAPIGFLVVGDSQFNDKVAQALASESSKVGSLQLGDQTQTTTAPRPGRRPRPAMVHISRATANALLAGTGKTIEDMQTEIDANLKPMVVDGGDVKVKVKIENTKKLVYSENVAAMIEGTDLKDEYVVISSHLDHVGLADGADCTEKNGDTICNGADDDGSGTVTTLAIAEAFMQATKDGNRPRRSILFLNVTGEEKGLFGSEYFADTDPLVPRDKIVSNLNIDMVGRHDPEHPNPAEKMNYVYIIGSNLISQDLHNWNQQVNRSSGVNLVLSERFNSKDDPNQFYRRSDHWNFGKHNIPFIFFFTGTHEDYHQVGDEPHKIEYDRMSRIGQMIFATTWEVANRTEKPRISGTGFNE